MANLQFEIQGKPNSIAFKSFVLVMRHYIKILEDLDSAISGEAYGSLDWIVTELKTGSCIVIAEPRSRIAEKNVALEVSKAFAQGFEKLEYEGTSPPYLSESGMKYATNMLKLIGREGITGYKIVYQSGSVELSECAFVNIKQLLPTRKTAFGSVEGTLEMISIHGGKPRFNIYYQRTNKAVTCNFAETNVTEVKDALGKRVIVMGLIDYNVKGEPIRVELERLRRFRSEEELPSISQMRGYARNLTGNMTTEEYLRSVRGE